MSSPRKWVLSVPDLSNVFTPKDIAPREEIVFENNEFDEMLNHVYQQYYQYLPSYFKGLITPTSPPKLITYNMINSDFTKLNVVVELQTTLYQTIRAFRTELVEAVKDWAADVTIPNYRGTRLHALKRPVVEWNDKLSKYVIRFDIVLSNIVFYSKFRTNQLDFEQYLTQQSDWLLDKINAVLPTTGITINEKVVAS